MKVTFATYEHSAIGFPEVVIRWSATDGKMERYARIVIKGVIFNREWDFGDHPVSVEARIPAALMHFDNWVRETFGNDPTVQG